MKTIDDHPPARNIPAPYQILPTFSFVRNPYDWYVSWYHYQKQALKTPFFMEISKGGTKSFKDTLLTIFEMDYNEFFKMDFSQHPNLGGYSAYLYFMYGFELDAVNLGRFETLRDDLLSILGNIVPLPTVLKNAIQTTPKANTSQHKEYSFYYDQELRELVRQKDKAILEAFGYTF
ncbi:MAG: hypothetical protein KDJ65_02550 [Anaerolineae bacterium]|nr:hypothetical protein [Anaerolineae bacterium]